VTTAAATAAVLAAVSMQGATALAYPCQHKLWMPWHSSCGTSCWVLRNNHRHQIQQQQQQAAAVVLPTQTATSSSSGGAAAALPSQFMQRCASCGCGWRMWTRCSSCCCASRGSQTCSWMVPHCPFRCVSFCLFSVPKERAGRRDVRARGALSVVVVVVGGGGSAVAENTWTGVRVLAKVSWARGHHCVSTHMFLEVSCCLLSTRGWSRGAMHEHTELPTVTPSSSLTFYSCSSSSSSSAAAPAAAAAAAAAAVAHMQAASLVCPGLRRLSYLVSSPAELDSALMCLGSMRNLRALELEVKGMVLSTEQLRVSGGERGG
jgi:hypothetical protein